MKRRPETETEISGGISSSQPIIITDTVINTEHTVNKQNQWLQMNLKQTHHLYKVLRLLDVCVNISAQNICTYMITKYNVVIYAEQNQTIINKYMCTPTNTIMVMITIMILIIKYR